MKCDNCRKEKPNAEYAPTSSAFFPQGHINICYDCIEKNVDGNDLNQVDRFCQHCNIAFMPNEWLKLWKRDEKGAFRKYLNSYYDLNYGKFDWGEQNERLMELAKNGTVEYEIEALKPEYIHKLKINWGDLPELDLLRLEKYFNSSLNDYNVQTEAQRDMLRKICRLSIMIDQDLINGKVDKDAIAQYDKLMTSALKTLETTQQEGISSVGQVIEFIERNGYQPRFYEGIPKDELDMLEKNIQEYLRDLVLGEVNITEIYERRKNIVERSEKEFKYEDLEDEAPEWEDE